MKLWWEIITPDDTNFLRKRYVTNLVTTLSDMTVNSIKRKSHTSFWISISKFCRDSLELAAANTPLEIAKHTAILVNDAFRVQFDKESLHAANAFVSLVHDLRVECDFQTVLSFGPIIEFLQIDDGFTSAWTRCILRTLEAATSLTGFTHAAIFHDAQCEYAITALDSAYQWMRHANLLDESGRTTPLHTMSNTITLLPLSEAEVDRRTQSGGSAIPLRLSDKDMSSVRFQSDRSLVISRDVYENQDVMCFETEEDFYTLDHGTARDAATSESGHVRAYVPRAVSDDLLNLVIASESGSASGSGHRSFDSVTLDSVANLHATNIWRIYRKTILLAWRVVLLVYEVWCSNDFYDAMSPWGDDCSSSLVAALNKLSNTLAGNPIFEEYNRNQRLFLGLWSDCTLSGYDDKDSERTGLRRWEVMQWFWERGIWIGRAVRPIPQWNRGDWYFKSVADPYIIHRAEQQKISKKSRTKSEAQKHHLERNRLLMRTILKVWESFLNLLTKKEGAFAFMNEVYATSFAMTLMRIPGVVYDHMDDHEAHEGMWNAGMCKLAAQVRKLFHTHAMQRHAATWEFNQPQLEAVSRFVVLYDLCDALPRLLRKRVVHGGSAEDVEQGEYLEDPIQTYLQSNHNSRSSLLVCPSGACDVKTLARMDVKDRKALRNIINSYRLFKRRISTETATALLKRMKSVKVLFWVATESEDLRGLERERRDSHEFAFSYESAVRNWLAVYHTKRTARVHEEPDSGSGSGFAPPGLEELETAFQKGWNGLDITWHEKDDCLSDAELDQQITFATAHWPPQWQPTIAMSENVREKIKAEQHAIRKYIKYVQVRPKHNNRNKIYKDFIQALQSVLGYFVYEGGPSSYLSFDPAEDLALKGCLLRILHRLETLMYCRSHVLYRLVRHDVLKTFVMEAYVRMWIHETMQKDGPAYPAYEDPIFAVLRIAHSQLGFARLDPPHSEQYTQDTRPNTESSLPGPSGIRK